VKQSYVLANNLREETGRFTQIRQSIHNNRIYSWSASCSYRPKLTVETTEKTSRVDRSPHIHTRLRQCTKLSQPVRAVRCALLDNRSRLQYRAYTDVVAVVVSFIMSDQPCVTSATAVNERSANCSNPLRHVRPNSTTPTCFGLVEQQRLSRVRL